MAFTDKTCGANSGSPYLWTSGVMVKFSNSSGTAYYYGSNQPTTLTYGLTVLSTAVCTSCPTISPGPAVTMYQAIEIPVSSIPFTLPVALPLKFVPQ
jgi:hypothetical protein